MAGAINIGILGGMFDPVHNGHLRMALVVQDMLDLDQVRLIPCHQPAHREPAIASAAQRLAMLHLSVAGEPQLLVDDRECQRPGPSYLFDTLSSLKQEMPAAHLFFILGVDAFNTLPHWHRWREIFALAHLVVIARPGWQIQAEGLLQQALEQRLVQEPAQLVEAEAGRIYVCKLEPLMISSSQIRDQIRQQKSPRYLLPDSVLEYIRQHKLYS
ncbi:MAG: nicotinate-nucleotide adenylyltransferase [Pseudomonadales bacterium]|nr:nicotinate-nucleotide adenylyltransferase [Pseudomonadales bacterium]